jgi:uncharacterized protein with HEPN domain
VRDDQLRFSDMAEAIRQIGKYAAEGKEPFEKNELVQVWIVHHLQVLGEAARGVSTESQNLHPQIPWSKIIGFRNILVHHYFAINPGEIWRVVTVELPPLKEEIEMILKK